MTASDRVTITYRGNPAHATLPFDRLNVAGLASPLEAGVETEITESMANRAGFVTPADYAAIIDQVYNAGHEKRPWIVVKKTSAGAPGKGAK